MRIVTEQQTAALVTPQIAWMAAREAMIAAARGGVTFPATIAHGTDPANRFSIKPGVTHGVAGLKIGSFWPGNRTQGLPCHSSLILLFNEATGRIETLVEAAAANALRTAAADAVATAQLARRDAHTLAVFGAGNQAFHEVNALIAVRPIERVFVVNRNLKPAEALATRLCAAGVAASVSDARQACRTSDIIVTATSARAALFDADWIRRGTHLSAMGADGAGKQELPGELLARASLFCDLPAQSIVLGEFQVIADQVTRGAMTLTPIGDVLEGRHPGRRSDDEITIFDSSGIALQDLALARHILSRLPAIEPTHA